MPGDRIEARSLVRLGGLALIAVVLAGCGVKQEYVDDQIARLRDDIRTSDEALSSRIDQVADRVSALERDLQSLRDEFNVKFEEFEGLITFDVPVHFEFDEAEIRPSDRPVLDRFAAVVREYYPEAIVTVEGFTDPAGSVEYNLKLGQARADAVREYLTRSGGLRSDLVRAVSYGKAPDRQIVRGAAGADNPAAIANRRVALVIDYSGPKPADTGRPTTTP